MRFAKPLLVLAAATALAAVLAFGLVSVSESGQDANAPSAGGANPGGGNFRGSDRAKVTLVEFGDYQCPSCAAYHPVVSQLLKKYPQQVRLEFHHFPLVSIHPNALMASMAAEAAGEQGRYWEMHDLLFEHQADWSQSQNAEAEFLSYGARIGLDSNRFMRAMRSPDTQQRVLSDVTRARQLAIDEVPAFFIDGQRLRLSAQVEEFEKAVAARF